MLLHLIVDVFGVHAEMTFNPFRILFDYNIDIEIRFPGALLHVVIKV